MTSAKRLNVNVIISAFKFKKLCKDNKISIKISTFANIFIKNEEIYHIIIFIYNHFGRKSSN